MLRLSSVKTQLIYCPFYVSVFANHFLIQTLSIKVNVSTGPHGLGS